MIAFLTAIYCMPRTVYRKSPHLKLTTVGDFFTSPSILAPKRVIKKSFIRAKADYFHAKKSVAKISFNIMAHNTVQTPDFFHSPAF